MPLVSKSRSLPRDPTTSLRSPLPPPLRKDSITYSCTELSWADLRDHVELHYLSIDPQHQRKGVGRLLVQEGLGRARAEGRDVWLRSTCEGRRLYKSLGFEEVGEGTVCGQRQVAMVNRAAPTAGG